MVWITIKPLLKWLGKKLLILSFNYVFKIIDKNKDGKISKTELKEFEELIKNKLTQIKK